jgi:hypothetical protein
MSEYSNDADFYQSLWMRLVGEEFSSGKLGDRLRRDGGVDMDLGDEDLRSLIEGRYTGSWSEVAFSFSELLASYSVPGGIETPGQVVGWVCASFVIADAIRNGATDWEMEFNKFINGFLAVRDRLEIEESIHIFEQVFHHSQFGSTPANSD